MNQVMTMQEARSLAFRRLQEAVAMREWLRLEAKPEWREAHLASVTKECDRLKAICETYPK